MCGDLYCPSCGPAQGNWRCSYCGVWQFDVEEENGVYSAVVEEDGKYAIKEVNSVTKCLCTPEDFRRYAEGEMNVDY